MTNPLIDAVTDALDKARDGDDRESIDNRRRGCGHLDPNACYLRSDLAALGSPDGDIPPFVEFDDPVEYREHTGRGAIIPGFKAFPGNSFTLHYDADGGTTTPEGDIHDHIERLSKFGFDGDHYADITSARSIDVLMSVGVSNYETPEEYIEECRTRGLNLKIPVSNKQEPPVVEPLRTRVFVIHPNGAGEGRPAIIGYAYVTRNVFTTGTDADADDPDVPKWAENYAKTRPDFDLVDRGEPVGEDEMVDDAQTTIEDAYVDDPPSGDGGFVSDIPTDDDPVSVQASDKPGRDVEEVPEDADDPKGSTDEVPLSDVDYNVLKAKAGRTDGVDVGQSPSKDELIDALEAEGITTATVGGSDE